ncbi:MAG: acyl-CoA/acyl-ACP dehydrogenase [Rhodospirillales bacterium]|nr:acyl-CoA/acyl-ACP dehydrogenase [Rhodospirillales bacterium]
MHVNTKDFLAIVDEIGPEIEANSAELKEGDAFLNDNVALLKKHKFYSAMVPKELGGGGVLHSEMCAIIRMLGRYCPSTALMFSMHQHLIATARWNYHRNNPGLVLLEKVAAKELVLVSTGAKDWLSSSGEMEKTEGGYLVTTSKGFASGSPGADIAVTSAPYEDPEKGWQVLHFPVPMTAEGVSIKENWKAMGMRNTGSHTIIMDKVFVPEEAVGVRRPQGVFHPMWSVVLTVAMPLIMSAYMGLAENAADIARKQAAKNTADPHLPYLLGEMENQLTTALVAYESMVGITNDFDFEPVVENPDNILKRKTIIAKAVIEVTRKAVELSGGPGYLRHFKLEQLFRDAHASQFHPLSEKKQIHFSGRLAMGLDPIDLDRLA